jgi:hypothetical protein
MSQESMRIWTENTVLAAMQASYPAVGVRFGNAVFLQPDTPWAKLVVIEGSSFGVNLGTRKVDRHVGLVQFDVLVPDRQGAALGNQIAEFIGDTLKTRKVRLADGAPVTFHEPTYMDWGRSGGFYRIICRVGFWRDESAPVATIVPV